MAAPQRRVTSAPSSAQIANTIAEDRRVLSTLRCPETGLWRARALPSASATAWTVLLYERLGVEPERSRSMAAALRAIQATDGRWGESLSATVEAYVALSFVGDEPRAPHMQAARAAIELDGGLRATRPITRVLLATFGLLPWQAFSLWTPQLMLMPAAAPVRLDHMSSPWRARAAAIAILCGRRTRYALPPWAALSDLPQGSPARRGLLARLGGRLGQIPIHPLLDRALGEAERWLLGHQNPGGSWHGFESTWLALMGLHGLGYVNHHPVVARGLQHLQRLQQPHNDHLLQCHHDRSIRASADALGALPGANPEALLDEQRLEYGDWAAYTQVAPGGFSIELDNHRAPDVISTARALLAFTARPDTNPATRLAAERASRWLRGMQRADGTWCCFDPGASSMVFRKHPWNDPSAPLVDDPCMEATAHAVYALCSGAGDASEPALSRAVACLLRAQRRDGSWSSSQRRELPTTCAAILALHRAGVPARSSALQAARAWLEAQRDVEDAWGEPGHTAQALRALSALDADPTALRRAAEALARLSLPQHGPELLSARIRALTPFVDTPSQGEHP